MATSNSNMVFCRGCGKQIHKTAISCPQCGARQKTRNYKSKVTAGILAILLGNLGIHRFYLGQWWGIFYLLFFWTFIPGLIAFIEGIVFLAGNQQSWDDKYNDGQESSGGESSAVMIVVAIVGVFVVIAIIGILAAIAIPAYNDYTIRAHVAESLALAQQTKTKATEYIVQKGKLPNSNADLELSAEIKTPFVQSIAVTTGGVIVIEYGGTQAQLKDKTLTLEPIIENNELRWNCTGGTLDKRYRPQQCR